MKPSVLIVFAFLLLGTACKEKKKYHDKAAKEVIADKSGVLVDIADFQLALNEEFKNPETSPLPDRFRKDFESLDFFPADTSYVVEARFVRTPDAIPFLMPTTTDRKSKEVVYGVAHFSLNGSAHELEIYQNEELMLEEGYEAYLFLPFTDMTNGEETYGGGRYLDLSIPKGNTILLDFNKAYNPYCTYNKKFSCPLVPGINDLKTRVEAGVKDFKKGYD